MPLCFGKYFFIFRYCSLVIFISLIISFFSFFNKAIIEIHPDIFNHIKDCIENEDYYHAVEEAYKVVIEKLRDITGEEQASKAFNNENYNKIFKKKAENQAKQENQIFMYGNSEF